MVSSEPVVQEHRDSGMTSKEQALRIGLIGSAGHTHYATTVIEDNPDLEVVGIASGPEDESAESLANTVEMCSPGFRTYERYPRMLSEENLDIVVVAPYFGHICEVTIAALEHDLNVFAEKPLATSLEQLSRLREAYQRSSRRLMAMFGSRYHPWFVRLSREIENGTIGEIRLLNAQKSYKLGNRGEPYLTRENYGGTIPWVGIHAIDWINWFTPGAFRSVTAHHSATGNRGHGDLETTAVAQFRLEEDVFATVSLDYLRPESSSTHGDDRIRIVGTKGVVEVRDRQPFLIADGTDGERVLSMPETVTIFEDFVGWVRGRSDPVVSPRDSFAATEAAVKARQSADQRAPVSFG